MCIHDQLSMQEITAISAPYPDVTNYLRYCRPYRITYPTFYEQTCDSEYSSNTLLPSHSCGHDIPESNAACMRVVCAMHTLHTLKLKFVKRFQTSPAVKFLARIFHTLPQCHYIFIVIKKKQTSSISNKILYVLYV